MKLLVDADILLYRYAFANTFSVDFDDAFSDEDILTFCDKEVAIAEMLDHAERMKKRLEASEIIWCLSDSSNFRYSLYDEYKANRNMSTVPTLKNVLKDWIKNNCNYLLLKNLEADDVMGIMQTDETIICTLDKDLDTITGMHYNWGHDRLYNVSQEEADKFFYTQILMGDSTDNIRGCPKIGKIKANRFIEENGTDWEAIVNLYHKQMIRYVDQDTTYEQAHEEALKNARLVYILRYPEEYTDGEVKLWNPS
jgi:DNA polymerase-1